LDVQDEQRFAENVGNHIASNLEMFGQS
jgi:hypothetical protein